MPHRIPSIHIDPLLKGPSDTKTTQVANLQNYIQDLLGETHHTFLQGSYVNDTAIADINDVDIVAIRKETYSGVHSGLVLPTSIPWENIFSEIETKLNGQSTYAWTITRGDKCIKIRGAFNADVIPAVKVGHDHQEDPIVVYSMRSESEKKNFLRTFYENGVAKNESTQGLYKQTVRIFKNWAKNHIDDDKVVSSFKMQALVYNSPETKFLTEQPLTFAMIGIDMLERLEPGNGISVPIISVCGSEDINQGWDPALRQFFITKLRQSVLNAVDAYQAQDQSSAERLWKAAFNLS